MKFYLNIESEDGENLAEFTAPTFELLSEKVGAWERAQKNDCGCVECLPTYPR